MKLVKPIVGAAVLYCMLPVPGGLAQAIFKSIPEVNLSNFAPGDGTNQTTAVQAAFTYAKSLGAGTSVFVPCGLYLVTTTIDITNVAIRGMGGCSQFVTTANITILQEDNDVDNLAYLTRENFTMVGNVSGTRTSNFGFKLVGTSNNWSYNTFRGVRCLGTYDCLNFSKNLNVAGEEGTDWNTFDNIQTSNFGANTVNTAIHFVNGSGTGNIIANSTLTAVNGIMYDATNGANVGDISISSIQVGVGGGTCFGFASGASYKSNISIANSQCDGGSGTSISAPGYNNMKVTGFNFGGATTYSFPGLRRSNVDANAIERRYGNVKTVASTTTDQFFSITFLASSYDSAMVEFVVEGLIQGVGAQARTSRYHVVAPGSCAGITATQLDTFTGGSTGTPFTITNALSTCTLTFSTSFTGASANSVLHYHARVVGGIFTAAMQ